MLDKFRHIRKLNGLYDVAVQSNSREIRLNTADVGLVISDINKLLSLVVDSQLNKPPVVIEEQDKGIADAGRF
jgi:hypothetical protein